MVPFSSSVPRRTILGALATSAAQLAAPHVARAAASNSLVRVGYFSKNLPTIVAEAKGFWSAQGLQVQLTQVAGSVPQAQALASGQYDLAFCSADNTVNYRLNDNNPLGQRLDFQIIAGQDLGAGLGLFSRAGFTTIELLSGAHISVDAADLGFAYVLYKMLREHGLERGAQYNVTPLGGTAQRFAALVSNQTDATLLSAGFDVRAAAAGFLELTSVNQLVRPYLGSVIEGSESWMESHREVVVRFLRGYYKALQWSLDPSKRDEAISLLLSTTPGADAKLATALYEAQADRTDGLVSDLTINVRIPTESSRPFRRKPAGDSDGNQPPIPRQSSHP